MKTLDEYWNDAAEAVDALDNRYMRILCNGDLPSAADVQDRYKDFGYRLGMLQQTLTVLVRVGLAEGADDET